MRSRPESDEALVKRLLPSYTPDRSQRTDAWDEWQARVGKAAVLKFIRLHNHTSEPDEDILQDSLLTAYLEVERGGYERREGIPFTAYVKGIARNKIREARRREQRFTPLEEIEKTCSETAPRQIETAYENREMQRRLWHGLAKLSPQRRQVLERYLFGASTAEIAAEMAITEELVRQHKCRGLRILAQQNRETGMAA
jgi:RNA polymerase sigma-70 factor, ECF subfamily